MVGFIFGIIFLIIGIVVGIILRTYQEGSEYKTDKYGKVSVDSDGNPIKADNHPYKKFSAIGFVGGIIVCGIFLACNVFGSVGTGKTGVVTVFGQVDTSKTLASGFYKKAPWEKVTLIDTTIQELVIDTPAYTNDSQTVELAISVQYNVSQDQTFSLVSKYGISDIITKLESNFKDRITTAAKNIIATKKADDLLTNRSSVVAELATAIDEFKNDYYVYVSAVNLTNLDFTDEYEAAVAAKVAQQQAYEKALIEQQQALAAAENDKKIAETNAEAAAAVKTIEAQTDLTVQQINADAAEYTGRKESAVVLNRLAGINGWTVVLDADTGIYQLLKTDGTEVTEAERAAGVEKLIEYYYTQTWNGELPDTYVGDDNVSSILVGNN